MYQKSTLFIVNDIESSINQTIATLPKHSYRVVQNEDESKKEFQLAQAQKAIKEAYVATSSQKYILLAGDSFRIEAQNSLLKVLEEPPKNVIFLIFTLSKTSILPTILSRVQVKYQRTQKSIRPIDLDLKNLTLKDIYSFLKQNQRVSKSEAKQIVESILFTTHKNNISLTQKELDSFSTAMKLLELNSRPINILTALLLKISKNV